jgi:hypothetical protein
MSVCFVDEPALICCPALRYTRKFASMPRLDRCCRSRSTRKTDARSLLLRLSRNWKDPESGEWLRTCTIITGEPNELVAQIHPRMPVILPPATGCNPLRHQLSAAGNRGTRTIVSVVEINLAIPDSMVI